MSFSASVTRIVFALCGLLFLPSVGLAQTPPPQEGLRLWLKADAGITPDATGKLATWGDQSGGNRSGTQTIVSNQPTLVPDALNGRPVVRFSGNQILHLPDFMPSGTATEGEGFVVLKASTLGGGFWNIGSREDTNVYTSAGTVYENFGSANRYQSGTSLLDVREYHLYSVSSKLNEWVSRQNGRVLQRLTSNIPGFRNNPVLGFGYLSHTAFTGDIAEVIIYSRVLSREERDAVGKYISTKYALIAPPLVPTALSALPLSNTQVSLVWTAAQGTALQYYEIERREGAGSYALIATATDVTGYLDNAVEGGRSYSYRVRVRNYSGVSEYSNEAPVTVPTEVSASMPTNGIKLWLKADAGLGLTKVAYWPDQSGVDQGGTQANAAHQPTLVPDALNGRPVVRFSGNQILHLPDFMPSGTAMEGEGFVVLKAITLGGGFWNIGSREDTNVYTSGGTVYENFGSANRYQSGTSLLDVREYHLYSVSSKLNEWVSRQNGRVLQRLTSNIPGFRNNPVLGFGYPSHTAFTGDIAEVIIYDRVLSDADRGAVNLYLFRKYNFGFQNLALVPSPGSFQASVDITIVSPEAGAEIFYTTDGTPPVRNISPRYTGPIHIAASTRIRAQAFSGDEISNEASGLYTIGLPPTTETTVSGVSATYYAGTNFTGSSFRRLDPQIAAPAADSLPVGWQATTLSVRWEGEIIPRFTESHTFTLQSNGGIRLWLGDQLLIDDWAGATSRSQTFTHSLTAGTRVPVRVEYQRKSPTMELSLSWSGFSTAQQVIPRSQLFSGLTTPAFMETPAGTPVAGTYPENVAITLATSSGPGARIFYTLNGEDPVAGTTLYTGPITLNGPATLKARAFATGVNDSGVFIGAYAIDNAGPTLSNLKFNGAAVPPVIGTDGIFSIDAADTTGVKEVEFRIDGELLALDQIEADGFKAPFSIRSVADGSHTLTVKAWDALGTASAVASATFTAALPAPARPTITSPRDNDKVGRAALIVRGTAEPGSLVRIYGAAVQLGSSVTAADGLFAVSTTLQPGINHLTATAQNRNASPSSASAVVRITFDNTVPSAAGGLSAQGRPGGAIQLSWNAPATGLFSGFYLFRSTSPIPSDASLGASDAIGGGILRDLSFTDSPGVDGQYYYRVASVYSVGGSETLSPLSNQADAVSDRTAPSGTVTLAPISALHDAAQNRFGRGLVQVALAVSEPLSAPPFLSLTVGGQQAIFVDLLPNGPQSYAGTFAITDRTRSASLSAVFSAYDVARNRGTLATLNPPAIIDAAGPKVIGVTPVLMLTGTTFQELPELKSIKNDPVAPATSVVTAFKLTFDEDPKPSTLPIFTATLSGHPTTPVVVTTTDAGDSDVRTRLIQVTLPPIAGVDTENLVLGFSATDDLSNPGDTIEPPHAFQVYKGDLPPLAVPTGLRAEALPAGEIKLSWNEVDGAVAYALQVKGPNQATFQDLAVPPANVFTHAYLPTADGAYSYRVASVRLENNQDATSGWSEVASATSDRVAPPAPTAFALQVIGQGVRASWSAPATNFADVAGYALYRNTAEITVVQALTPVLPDIPKALTAAVDPSPAPTLPYYALVAYDLAGNRSAPVRGFVNVSLLPVQSLKVSQVDRAAPVLTWEKAAGSVIDGFNLSVAGAPVLVNGQALLPTSRNDYTDTDYVSGDRLYSIATVSGPEKRPRSITLPAVSLSVPSSTTLNRGLVNTVNVLVHNLSTQPLSSVRVFATAAGRVHASANTLTLAAGAEQVAPIVVGGYDELPAPSAPLSITLTTTENAGEQVSLTHTATVQVAGGAMTAEMLPAEFNRGGTGQVRFKLTNPSANPIEFKVARNNGNLPSDEARLLVKNAAGVVLSSTALSLTLGDYVVALPDGTTVVRIPATVTYTSPVFLVPVPASAAAHVTVALEVDAVYYNFGQPDTQIKLKGPRAQADVSTRETTYSAEITSVSPAESFGKDPIVIQGRALLRGIDPALPAARAADVPVVVNIALDGFLRQNVVLSDGAGNFAYTFLPGVSEKGGIYKVWASHPDIIVPPDTTATFTLKTVTVSPQAATLRVPRNYRRDIPIEISTGPAISLTNLRAVLIGSLPASVSATASTIAVLGPNDKAFIPLSIVGTAPTSGSTNVGELEFKIISDGPGSTELLWATVRVNYEFSEARPNLQGGPNPLEFGVQPSQTASVSLTVKNVGFGPLEEAQVSLIPDSAAPLPSWVQLQTPAALGLIDVGAEKVITVSAVAPPAVPTSDQFFSGLIRVQGRDFPAQDFPIYLTLSPSGLGKAIFKIVDPYFGLTLPEGAHNPSVNGLVGASVVLEKESSTGIPTSTVGDTTGPTGEVIFENLPAGRYRLRVSADRHEPVISRITVSPGVVSFSTIQLAYNPVSFTWEVVPVTFQDRYQVVLTSTFETNVPVPVVVVEPGSITLPTMCAGQVYSGEIRITNHGLIDADDVQVPLPSSDEYFSFELLATFGDKIKAGQTVRLPYRVKCLKPLPGECPAVASADRLWEESSALARAADDIKHDLRNLYSPAYTPRLASAAGPSSTNGGCSGYSKCESITYTYICANGQTYTSVITTCFTTVYGCSPSTSNSNAPVRVETVYTSPTTPGGSSSSSCPWCGSGSPGTSTTESSDDCFPYPPGCGDGAGGDPCSRANQLCNDRKEPTGSWVDRLTRQYRDWVDEFIIPVPGGEVRVSRDFYYRHWQFRPRDKFYSICSLATTECALILNGKFYQKFGSSFGPATLARGGFASFRPDLQPPSRAPEGVYLLDSKGPEKIVRNADGTLVWSNAVGLEKTYSGEGSLLSEKRRGLVVAEYHYDGSGQLVTITDRSGRTIVTFIYTDGKVTTIRDLAGRETTYTYDPYGRMVNAIDISGTTYIYTYDNWWQMTEKRIHLVGAPIDDDHVVTIKYRIIFEQPYAPTPPVELLSGISSVREDIAGMVESVAHSTGEKKTFVYKFRETSYTDHIKVTSQSGREEETRINWKTGVSETFVNGERESRTQNEKLTQITTRGANQQVTEEYDTRDNLLRRVYADGSIETWEYDNSTNLVKRHIAVDGSIDEYEYDDLGNETKHTEAVGTPLARSTTNTFYPGTKLLKERTEPGNRRTAYEYDDLDRLIRISDPANPAAQTLYTYDVLGRKLTMTDALGHVTHYAYDAAGHVVEETNAMGEKTVSTYQGNNLIQLETGRVGTTPGRIVRYTYDSIGRILGEKRVDADGAEHVFKTYTYDNEGRLVAEANALGQSVSFGYDDFGQRNLISRPGADGERSEIHLTNDVLGRVLESRDSLGLVTKMAYDQSDRLLETIEAAGTPLERKTRISYDILGQIIQLTYSNNQESKSTTHSYDGLRRKTGIAGDRIYPTTNVYGITDNVLSSKDALGRTTSYDYDAYNRIIAVKLDGATTQTFAYDLNGNLLVATDGAGNHRHFRYDALNRLTHESIPLLSSQAVPSEWWTQPSYILHTQAYNAWNEVISETTYTVDSAGVRSATTGCIYDVFGRKVKAIDATGLTITYQYNAADKLEKVIYPSVASSGELVPTTEIYLRSPFAVDLVDAYIDRSGHTTHYVYDKALRVVEETNSLGGVTRRTYDALGRVATLENPATEKSSYDYDLFDQLVKTTFADHIPGTNVRIEQITYDRYGNVLSKTGAGGYPLTFKYDAVGNRIEMTDANNRSTKWTYTNRNRVETRTLANGKSWTFGYDPDDRLRSRLDPLGRTTTYDYNAFGLTAKIDYPTTPDVTFAYDQQGNRVSMMDGSGTTLWSYDAQGRVTAESQTRSRRTITYAYDNYNNRTVMNVGRSDLTADPWLTTYQYDNAGRLSAIADSRLPAASVPGALSGTFQYSYHPQANLLQGVLAPSGTTMVKTYDNLGRVQSVVGRRGDNSAVNSSTYNYGADGQRKDEITLTANRVFKYDAYRQLINSVATSAGSEVARYSYTYDEIGNRKTAASTDATGSQSTGYTVDPINAYSNITGTGAETPLYDDNGNTKGIRGLILNYDDENRLIEVADVTRRSDYVYDGLGRRVEAREQVAGVVSKVTRYIYDSRRVVEETDESFASVRSYTRGLDFSGSLEGAGGVGGLLAMSKVSGGSWTSAAYLSDGQGNVTDLIDFGGTSVAHYEYTPFGQRIASAGAWANENPYQFSSKEFESSWNLYYFGHRFYDPGVGRWLTLDPLHEAGDLNPYGFINNNSGNSIDPDGQLAWLLIIPAVCGLVEGTMDAINAPPGERAGNFLKGFLSGAVNGALAELLAPAGPAGFFVADYISQQLRIALGLQDCYDPVRGALSFVLPGVLSKIGAATPFIRQAAKFINPFVKDVGTVLSQSIKQAWSKGINALVRAEARILSHFPASNGFMDLQSTKGFIRLPGAQAAERVASPYAGIRQASQYLQELGVSRAQRVQILQSFEAGTVNLRAAGSSEFGLRFFDGVNAQARGRFLFETFPASRESLALSSRWNQMTNFTQWQIREGSMLIEGRAAAQGAGLPGGQIQKFVPNLDDLFK